MPTHTIELSDHDDAWLQNAVESGRFLNLNAAIEDAIGLLEAHDQTSDEKRLERLRQIAREGFEDAEGPDAIVLSNDAELEAYMSAKLRKILTEEETESSRAQTAA